MRRGACASIISTVLCSAGLAAAVPRPRPSDACGLELAAGDSARFLAMSRSTDAPGSLRAWFDSTEHLSYVGTWFLGNDKWSVEGSVLFGSDGPAAYNARVLRNGNVLTSESAQVAGDSLIVVRSARTATTVKRGVIPVPGLLYAPVRMILVQCALQRPNHEYETSRFGRVRAEEVAATTIHAGSRSAKVRLFLLSTGAGGAVARVWVDDHQTIVAYPGAEGEVDLVKPEWKAARAELLDAEVRASSPNCHFGGGPGGCENTPRICNLPTPLTPAPVPVRSVVIIDSGYSVRSDGRGAYIRDSMNVVVRNVGLVAGLELEGVPRGVPARSFVVDLGHPVPGDIGKPLGVVSVDGRFPGRFNPSGTFPGNELLAHANTDWDEKQHSLSDLPVGSSTALDQLDLDFYRNGVLHMLQMGPQPYGHCQSGGTAVFGDGTSRGTFSHPDPNHWVIDVPRGSIGRLFANPSGDAKAVNRGLYYLSLHIVLVT
jgi:hypothetical protein